MPNITAPALTFPTKSFPGAQAGVPAGVLGELVFSEILPKYATLAKAQKMYYASITYATAPASFLTAAQFGPVLWNSSGSNIDAYLLAVGISNLTTANTGGGAGAAGRCHAQCLGHELARCRRRARRWAWQRRVSLRIGCAHCDRHDRYDYLGRTLDVSC